MSVTYRKIDASNDKDFELFLKMEDSLDNYLKTNKSDANIEKIIKWKRARMGAVNFLDELVPENDTTVYKKQLMKCPDEVCYIAESDGEVVGYILYLNYSVMNGKRLGEEYGNINAIFVNNSYRRTDVAFTLLRLALDDLLKNGKTKATLTVQEDNKNRFLHFAMADCLLDYQHIKRANGTETISYDMEISDLNKLKNMSLRELAEKALKIRKHFKENNLTILDVIEKKTIE